ncbi:MAG: alpha/beta hydrolase, partial [Rhodospirillales bacterium]
MIASKKPLILVPGMLCDETLWRHSMKDLSEVAEMTVADLTLDESINAMAVRILESGPPVFALAGLSMGGYVAQEIMRLAPQRVDRLALLDTSPDADSPEHKEKRRIYIEQTQYGDFRGVTQKLLPLLIHPDRMNDKALCDTVIMMTMKVGKEAFIRQQHAMMGLGGGIRDLERIQCPVLVLCGRQDELTPLEIHDEMARSIPNATQVVIENCGHLPPLEKPD